MNIPDSMGKIAKLMASMVMLFARTVLWLLAEAQVIDTVIYGLSFWVCGLPVWLHALPALQEFDC